MNRHAESVSNKPVISGANKLVTTGAKNNGEDEVVGQKANYFILCYLAQLIKMQMSKVVTN